MAVTADSVVVELIAKTDGYRAAVEGAANTTATSMSRIEQSASRAEGQIVRSAGAMANAQRNLGRQFADIGASLSSGSSPFVVLAQQLPQVADALTDTGGRAARFAAFLTGPFGAALLAAASVAGVLAGKMLEGGDTVESLGKKLQASAEKARLSEQAQAIFAKSIEGTVDASKKLIAQLEQQNKSQIQVARSALIAADAQRQQAASNLRAEVSKRTLALADVQRQNGGFSTGATAGGAGAAALNSQQYFQARQRQRDAEASVKSARDALALTERTTAEARIPILKLEAEAASSKPAGAVRRHSDAVDKLTASYRAANVAASKLTGEARIQAFARANTQYAQGVEAANRRLDAEQDAIRESNRRGPRGPSAETLRKRAEREAAKDAKELKDLIDAIGESAIKSLDDVNRLFDNKLSGFSQIFGREGVDFSGPSTADYDREIRLEGEAREAMLDRLQRKQEQDIYTLSSLYQDAFDGGVKGIWDTFRREGLQAIAVVLAQLTIGKSLGDAFKSAQGGLFGGLFGRASGGYVGPGQTVRVNEQRPGVELLRMGPQGGTVIPLGQQAAATPDRGGTTVMQTIQVDARGAVMNDQFASQILARAQRDAGQIVKANNAGIRAALPGQLDRYGKLGTTG